MDFMRNGRNWRVNDGGMHDSPSLRRSSGGIGLVRSEDRGGLVKNGVTSNTKKIGNNYKSNNFIASGDISSESPPSALTQWAEWSPQTSMSYNREASSMSSGRTSTAVERELLRTKEVLMQYKTYVEQRLMRYIKELEEDRTHREKLCVRLKHDNKLLLEELDRFRSGTTITTNAQRPKRQCHNWHDGYEYPFSSSSHVLLSPSQVKQQSGELLPKTRTETLYTLQTLHGREGSLLEQLQKERAKQAQLEAVHANAVARLQEQVEQLEQDRRSGVDAHTIKNLRDALAQRDDEIRKLRKLHGLSPPEPSGSGKQTTVGVTGMERESIALEIQHMAADAVEFISAMKEAASTTTPATPKPIIISKIAVTNTTSNPDSHTNMATIEGNTYFANLGNMWEDLCRLSTSHMDEAFHSPHRSSHLLSITRSLRCAMEEEHNQIALFVQKILRENEELRMHLTSERRDWEIERQAATHRLSEVEEDSAALVQQLRQQLQLTTQRGFSCTRRISQSIQREHEKNVLMLSGHIQRCDVGTQTLLSVELSQLMEVNKGHQIVSTSISNEQFMNQLFQVLREMEILERDNAEKSVLLAQLQQQRERFLSGVDTELAHKLPTRASLTANFGQYLLE
ncbi:hypothetical protein LSM04_005425 [Trypanosoma melophagium]|uniref:uncharacterized protein n=1 Tax=Trypanosoma melophagium TaxID=715481 RepID=UPI00351A123D|nr:hypothetical protein LSM04_005425 [Trypanosoma melophagium]